MILDSGKGSGIGQGFWTHKGSKIRQGLWTQKRVLGTDKVLDSRVQRGDETKAHSFSGPVVLVFEASQHPVPDIL